MDGNGTGFRSGACLRPFDGWGGEGGDGELRAPDGLGPLIAGSESRLTQIALNHAAARGFNRYTPTMEEAWRMVIRGLSAAVLAALERGPEVPELDPDEPCGSDPATSFGVMEARRHRERGISLPMFLGLLKYLRQSYVDLARETGWPDTALQGAHRYLDRVFDRIEIGFVSEWGGLAADGRLTELQEANRRLVNEKNRYLTLFESLSSPALLLDESGAVALANHAAAALAGVGHLPGASYYSGVDFAGRLPWLPEIFAAFKASGEPKFSIARTIEADGGGRHFQVGLTRMLDISEKFAGTLVELTEVTGLHEAFVALQESEERFRILFHNVGEGVGIVDGQERFTMTNPAADRIFGVLPQSLEGRSLADFLPPGEMERVKAETVARVGGATGSYDLNIVRPGGDLRCLQVTASPQVDSSDTYRGAFGVFRDITEERRAEQIVERQANFLRVLMDSIPVPVFVKDTEGGYVDCNPAFEAFTGLKRENLVGKTVYDLFPPDFARIYHEKDMELFRDGGVQVYKAKARRWDGETRSVMYHKASHNTGNTVGGLVGVMLDITESERLTERLQIANLVMEESHTVLFRWGAEEGWPVEFVSDNVSQFGYDAVTLCAARTPFATLIASEDIEIVRTRSKAFQEAGGESLRQEYRIVSPKGRIHWVEEQTTMVLDPDGGVLGYHGTLTDFTARREAEEEVRRLAHAVEHSAESIVITDPEANILYVNPAFEQVTGYGREEALGQNPRILKSDVQGPEVYRELWGTLTAGKTWHGRLMNRRKDGGLFVEDATISPVLDGVGKIVNYIAVKRDVTREAHLEEELQQSQKMHAVGQLAGGVAHDFNNSLMAILSFAELALGNAGVPPGPAGHLREIRRAAGRAAALTAQLLAFGRKQILQPRRMDLRESVGGTVSLLHRLLGEEIRLEMELDDSVWPVRADPVQVDQVILNLALNARDAMPGGGTLTLSLHNESWEEMESLGLNQARVPSGRYVVLGVADTGEGMTPEIRAQIFDPFFTTKEPGKGTGLGLSTTHGIVKQSGGEIWVTSDPGFGCLFQVFLPAISEEEEVPPADVKPSEAPSTRCRRVLLAEDEEPVRLAATLLLEHLGYEVRAASGVEEAKALFGEDPGAVDLLLTDMVMPDGSGTDLYAALCETRPGLRVIFMSGYTEDRMIRAGSLTGVMAFLPKPFSVADLRAKFDSVFDGSATSSLLGGANDNGGSDG